MASDVPSTGTVWHAPAPARLARAALDSLIALYDRASGQTHLLASPAPEILDALGDGPATAPELVARLKERFDLPESDARQAIEARLAELAALGLVEAR